MCPRKILPKVYNLVKRNIQTTYMDLKEASFSFEN